MNKVRARLRAKLDARLGKEVVDARDRILRQEFIDGVLTKGKGKGKYVKELTRKEVEDDYPYVLPALDSKLTGREILVEYHLFAIMDTIPLIQQRRVVS